MRKTETSKATFRKKRLIIPACIVAAVVVAYFAFLFAYKDKFYPNTTVNDINVSGMTSDEAAKLLDTSDQYKINITGRDYSETINGTDIGYKMNVDAKVDECLAEQHEHFFALPTKHEISESFPVTYDKEKLKAVFEQSSFVKGTEEIPIAKPVNATISFDQDKMDAVIIPEEEGNTIDAEKALAMIDKQIASSKTSFDMTSEAVYKEPEVRSESEELKEDLQTYRKSVVKYINWSLPENTTDGMTPEDIASFVTVEDGEYVYDDEKLEDWVENFCLKYKTVGKDRTFTDHAGEKVTIEGGDFGWRLDYDKTIEQAKEAIETETSDEDLANYSKDNAKAVTVTLDPSWESKGQVWDQTTDWNTDRYTEVDIGEQHVYIMRNGKVEFDCRCITGKDSTPTETGTYYLKEKQYYRVLKASDGSYETPVNYWSRITWSGIGFHAAPWQPFGTDISYYHSGGSHGCVNLSVENAEKVQDLLDDGECIFVHK